MGRASLIDELQSLADGLAARVHQSVAVDDPAGRLLAVSRHFGDADEYRMKLMLERRIPTAYREFFAPFLAPGVAEPIRVPENPELSILPRIGYPIYVDRTLVAFLWLINLGRELDEALITSYRDRMRELLSERLEREWALGADDQVQRIRDLIAGRPVAQPENARGDAATAGHSYFVATSHFCDHEGAGCAQARDVQRFLRRLPDMVMDQGFKSIAQAEPDGLTVAVYRREASADFAPETMYARFSAEAQRILRGTHEPGSTCRGFGMSEVGDISRVRELFAQSALAAFLSHRLGGPEPMFVWPHIQGLARSLVLPADTPQSPAFTELVRLMGEEHGYVFDTVGALLSAETGTAEAARILGVHRTTLHYRVQQIQEATGLNLQLPGDRHLAFDSWLRASLARSEIAHLAGDVRIARSSDVPDAR